MSMNILSINNINFLPKIQNKDSKIKAINSPNFELKMSQPPTQDTLSFKAYTKKEIVKRSHDGINLATAKKIESLKKPIQEQIRSMLNLIFAENKNIEYISGEVKSAKSIVEKSITRKWNTTSDVLENMTDLNRFKICLITANKSAVKRILKQLLPFFKNNNLILTEMEQKIPGATKFKKAHERESYFYADPTFLQEYCDAAQGNRRKIKLDSQDETPTNYSAIHMLIKAPTRNFTTNKPEWANFELQIMGHDVAVYKNLDDLIFKVLNGKNIAKKYSEIEKILSPLVIPNALIKTPATEIIKLNYSQLSEMGCSKELLQCNPRELLNRVKSRREFDAYRAKTFLRQREKEPLPPEQRGGDDLEFFEPLDSNILPRKYDLNNLYRLMKSADARASAAEKIDSDMNIKTVKPKRSKTKV